jgi:hypothetical protein
VKVTPLGVPSCGESWAGRKRAGATLVWVALAPAGNMTGVLPRHPGGRTGTYLVVMFVSLVVWGASVC